MPTIIKKKKGNQYYYYIVESKRIEGKPRIVWQKYLGRVQDILDKLEKAHPDKPISARVFDFGAIAALYSVARRIRLIETIDAHVSKRDQGLTVGEYMAIAAINRAVAPTSKRRIGEWYQGTVLRRLIPSKPGALSSQRFWHNMGYLDEHAIASIEADLASNMVKEFNLNLECAVYDTTNFFTYIDTRTDSELSRRGHNKQKRNDLRQVDLALMATVDFFVPLFHEVYPGNSTDSQEFGCVTDKLVKRYKALYRDFEHITLVIDKGNNSKENFSSLALTPLHFVGSLVPSHHKDLLSIPISKFEAFSSSYAGEVAYRTKKKIGDYERTVAVIYSESLRLGQMQGLITTLRRITDALNELQHSLNEWISGKVVKGKKPTTASVSKRVEGMLRGEPYIRDIVKVQIELENGFPSIRYTIDQNVMDEVMNLRFGKTLLCTDNENWTTEQIVAAYRHLGGFENDFKQMKDPYFVSWAPMFHWTDQKIRVHAFYCVLALCLVSLLKKWLSEKGIEMSIASIIETLSEIEEVAHIYPEIAHTRAHITLTEMSDIQKKLFDELGLKGLAMIG
ncbi:MAG: IS1634 family transposase [Firmicutes bacterium]|nr:IS1634 family transposase [Bacillota bacterium]